MGRRATELENLNEEGGELTFCYVGVFDLSILKKVFMEAELKDAPQSDISDIFQGLF